ncbi:MAG: signal peptide peptidase SppA [Alphaproteobacteria bacterium]
MLPFESDALIDRARLKRRLALWRALAIAAAAVLAAVVLGRSMAPWDMSHIARLSVSGVIIEDSERERALDDLFDDPAAEALIVRIESPGGTVVGGEQLLRGLRRVAEKMPVVAVMDTFATSAGYMVALGADRIIAREGTITGSIGVIYQTTNVQGLLAKLGVTTEAIKSGELKAVPSPLEPITPKAREATRRVVLDIFDMFVDVVAERRGLERARVLELSDGRVYTGREALKIGLVDGLGGELEAIRWLEDERGVTQDLPVRDVESRREDDLWRQLGSLITGKTTLSETLTLDGLVSVWHP